MDRVLNVLRTEKVKAHPGVGEVQRYDRPTLVYQCQTCGDVIDSRIKMINHMKKHSPLPGDFTGCGWKAHGLKDLSIGKQVHVPDQNTNFWKLDLKEAEKIIERMDRITQDD